MSLQVLHASKGASFRIPVTPAGTGDSSLQGGDIGNVSGSSSQLALSASSSASSGGWTVAHLMKAVHSHTQVALADQLLLRDDGAALQRRASLQDFSGRLVLLLDRRRVAYPLDCSETDRIVQSGLDFDASELVSPIDIASAWSQLSKASEALRREADFIRHHAGALQYASRILKLHVRRHLSRLLRRLEKLDKRVEQANAEFGSSDEEIRQRFDEIVQKFKAEKVPAQLFPDLGDRGTLNDVFGDTALLRGRDDILGQRKKVVQQRQELWIVAKSVEDAHHDDITDEDMRQVKSLADAITEAAEHTKEEARAVESASLLVRAKARMQTFVDESLASLRKKHDELCFLFERRFSQFLISSKNARTAAETATIASEHARRLLETTERLSRVDGALDAFRASHDEVRRRAKHDARLVAFAKALRDFFNARHLEEQLRREEFCRRFLPALPKQFMSLSYNTPQVLLELRGETQTEAQLLGLARHEAESKLKRVAETQRRLTATSTPMTTEEALRHETKRIAEQLDARVADIRKRVEMAADTEDVPEKEEERTLLQLVAAEERRRNQSREDTSETLRRLLDFEDQGDRDQEDQDDGDQDDRVNEDQEDEGTMVGCLMGRVPSGLCERVRCRHSITVSTCALWPIGMSYSSKKLRRYWSHPVLYSPFTSSFLHSVGVTVFACEQKEREMEQLRSQLRNERKEAERLRQLLRNVLLVLVL
ncbi:MAG: hypothetical protein MHM6MM_002150 [Cercozoa sp. M6MM]